MKWYYLPFLFQGLIMGVDELLHVKRSLPKWERIGHPLDTLTVFSSYLFLVLFDYSSDMAKFYIGLCVFSCLFVTKDEFVHAKNCSPVEHWLHSLLFVLHPLAFISGGLIWKDSPQDSFLYLQPTLTGIFMLYQTIRWNTSWQPQKK